MTSDREYATEVLNTVISGNAHHLAERLLAALKREEKLREALSRATALCLAANVPSEEIDPLMDVLYEPHGNFSDTQDETPEGGC